MTLFEAEFERCSKWLQDALDYAGNTHDLADVKKSIQNKEVEFWPAPNGAIVTMFIDYPKTRVLHAWLVAGELPQIEAMIPSLVTFGRHFGCSRITGIGRAGWVRALKKHGFTGIMTTVSKEIA
jgi:hypothetical protein